MFEIKYICVKPKFDWALLTKFGGGGEWICLNNYIVNKFIIWFDIL